MNIWMNHKSWWCELHVFTVCSFTK